MPKTADFGPISAISDDFAQRFLLFVARNRV
jgi:hypothetical protein